MIEFKKEENQLVMKYRSDNWGDDWLSKRPLNGETPSLYKGCLKLRFDICLTELSNKESDETIDFVFSVGQLENEYFKIDRDFLDIEFDLYLHLDLKIERQTFIAETNISVFRKIGDLVQDKIYIGGDQDDALPQKVFEELLKQFPSRYELNKYAKARVCSLIRDYLPIEIDFEESYNKYLNNKVARQTIAIDSPTAFGFGEHEFNKYSTLIDKIETMLNAPDHQSEHQWQVEILKIVTLLYPKYVHAIREAPVKDSLANKDRSIDFMLIDSAGYVDAIEIKKPFAKCIVTSNRYRDNHVPMRELSGTVMQLEKYLYHLNRWGFEGEKKLNRRYADQLPHELSLKVVNPSGMIIMGRDQDLSDEQRTDFEVIKRKYRHILEIMTYDDMLRRLKTIRDRFETAIQTG